jgi:hypothetical protein
VTETTGETYSTEYIEPEGGQDREPTQAPERDKHPDGDDDGS